MVVEPTCPHEIFIHLPAGADACSLFGFLRPPPRYGYRFGQAAAWARLPLRGVSSLAILHIPQVWQDLQKTRKMFNLTLRVWLLFNILGALILYVAWGLIEGFDTEPRNLIFYAFAALFPSTFATIPLMFGFGFIGSAVWRKSGLAAARGAGTVIGIIGVPVTFQLICACFPREDAGMFGLLSIPYVISFLITINILRWPAQTRPDAMQKPGRLMNPEECDATDAE